MLKNSTYLCKPMASKIFIKVSTEGSFKKGTSQVVQWKRICLPKQEMQETQVRSLGWEDPLELKMAGHFNILACKNSMDKGAWWATVHGFTKSRTRLSSWAHTQILSGCAEVLFWPCAKYCWTSMQSEVSQENQRWWQDYFLTLLFPVNS